MVFHEPMQPQRRALSPRHQRDRAWIKPCCWGPLVTAAPSLRQDTGQRRWQVARAGQGFDHSQLPQLAARSQAHIDPGHARYEDLRRLQRRRVWLRALQGLPGSGEPDAFAARCQHPVVANTLRSSGLVLIELALACAPLHRRVPKTPVRTTPPQSQADRVRGVRRRVDSGVSCLGSGRVHSDQIGHLFHCKACRSATRESEQTVTFQHRPHHLPQSSAFAKERVAAAAIEVLRETQMRARGSARLTQE